MQARTQKGCLHTTGVCNNATLINDYIDHGGSKELATKDIYDGLAHSAVLEMDACIYDDPADCLMDAKVHFNDANGGTMSEEDFVMLYEESELDSTCAGTCPTTITVSTHNCTNTGAATTTSSSFTHPKMIFIRPNLWQLPTLSLFFARSESGPQLYCATHCRRHARKEKPSRMQPASIDVGVV